MVLAFTKEKKEMVIGIENLISHVLAEGILHEVSKLKRLLGSCQTSIVEKTFLGMNISMDEEE
jgi:hypothetical protein